MAPFVVIVTTFQIRQSRLVYSSARAPKDPRPFVQECGKRFTFLLVEF